MSSSRTEARSAGEGSLFVAQGAPASKLLPRTPVSARVPAGGASFSWSLVNTSTVGPHPDAPKASIANCGVPQRFAGFAKCARAASQSFAPIPIFASSCYYFELIRDISEPHKHGRFRLIARLLKTRDIPRLTDPSPTRDSIPPLRHHRPIMLGYSAL